MADYPEHEKQRAVIDQARAQGDFLDWLLGQGYVVAKEHAHFDDDGDSYCYLAEAMGDFQKTRLLAQYHGIDLNKIAAEKSAMLDEQRALNEKVRG
jgi:hypothetical protein